jgi:hypothetical protein
MEPKILTFDIINPRSKSIISKFYEVPEEKVIKLARPFEIDCTLYEYQIEETIINIISVGEYGNMEYNCKIQDKLYITDQNYRIEDFNICPLSNDLRRISNIQTKVFAKTNAIFKQKSNCIPE